MPKRRQVRRTKATASNPKPILEPGVSKHGGLYQGNSANNIHPDGRKSRILNPNSEEGVLYTVKVTERPSKSKKSEVPPPQSDKPQSDKPQPQQYTISKIRRPDHVTWASRLCASFGIELNLNNVDTHLYRPSKPLAVYINWTFYASFTAVFFSFLVIFFVLCLLFAGFLALAGHFHPDCMVVSGDPYGTNPASKFSDAFAMSWTTFTTVGYGNVYTATGNDFDQSDSEDCTGVVFLCTLESFTGLLYAGMCAAILFGKVNRVQSHAHLTFANAVCLQYEDGGIELVDDDLSDSDCDVNDSEVEEGEKKSGLDISSVSHKVARPTFRETFKGCPVLKFQVVNDFCNKGGGEIVDGMMKVVGIKAKTKDGKITHSQYVRVNLVDSEHPFFGRVWHGVHILDTDSPLLTNSAKERIRGEFNGSWPEEWLVKPEKIRRKLDFQSLVITVSGISNISACTVHAYKRYKFQDVIIGFDFAPLVYENEELNKLEVDMSLTHDVREQHKGSGEDLKNVHIPLQDGQNLSKGSGLGERGSSTLFHASTGGNFSS
mmetsp:Transcript_8269/g.15478  ORF Transcript_8269/g.15478 Transcript_8269/m.15478 type:complete len:546 (-) Transcript_8269:135-1772(-)|eukprot:CAMPEP_0196133806 /NCGR_PEP_ID=MMETSP0910-20130528/2868_1 /TAXON_ID=49265 /ORGANISM="Thalassiosira rotula, Strain GSO102" /LENGTH=545 /DNA_ID=CAMNT_0041393557 /DNA_START=229 /DNA_END=1866 /DNA_ORIENTATION=-